MLITEAEAAKMLCTTPATLRVQRATGQKKNGAPVVPFIRMGRKIAYDTLDIEQYIDAHRVDPTGGGREGVVWIR